MATTGFTSSMVSSLTKSGFDVTNSVPNLTAREYGYPSHLPVAQNQTIDHLIKSRYRQATGLYSKNLYAHYGCINAIEFSKNGQLMVSGSDDRRVLLWNVEKALSDKDKPIAMQAEHTSNIFCLGFDSENRHIFSGGNDEQVIIHDVEERRPLSVILHREVIYCLSVDPQNDNLFATACDEGRIFLFDRRESYNLDNLPVLIHTRSAFHAVMHNPVESRFIVTANSREGVSLWDIRNPRRDYLKYNGGLVTSQSAMSVRFNSTGKKIVALRRRLPAILYNTVSPHPIAEFDHKDYYNSCTMKSCCFGGSDDEYILSGSDDFCLYMWKIPDEIRDKDYSSDGIKWVDETHFVLRGHRSIVNQVRYNYANSVIASSGVEKVIKVWSLFDIFDPSEKKENKNISNSSNRKVYSHEEYIQLVLESGQHSAHDYSNQSVQEDPRMMAFFDSLVQRDIEGLTTDTNSDESDSPARMNSVTRNHARIDSQSESQSSDEELQLFYPCDDQLINYIKSFSERMESSVNRLYGSSTNSTSTVPNESNNNINDNLYEPSTSSSRPRASTSTSGLFNPNQSSSSPPSESSRNGTVGTVSESEIDTNKISQLINEKKKEQLRKVIRSALRTTRSRLRDLKKYLSREEDSSNGYETNQAISPDAVKLKNQLEDVLKILEKSSQKIDSKCRNNRGQLHRMMYRLRYLANGEYRNGFFWRGDCSDNERNSDSDEEEEMQELANHNFHRIASQLTILLTAVEAIVERESNDSEGDPNVDDGTSLDEIHSPSSSDRGVRPSSDSSISQIKSPDFHRDRAMEVVSSDVSSTSSDEDEGLIKVQRRRSKSERLRVKSCNSKNKDCISSSSSNIGSSDTDDSSSVGSSSESEHSSDELSRTEKCKPPRPVISYVEESDHGFDGDNESSKKRMLKGLGRSKVKVPSKHVLRKVSQSPLTSCSEGHQTSTLSSHDDSELNEDDNNRSSCSNNNLNDENNSIEDTRQENMETSRPENGESSNLVSPVNSIEPYCAAGKRKNVDLPIEKTSDCGKSFKRRSK